MKKNATIKRSAASGQVLFERLGQSKAKKFSLVEGVTLNAKHSKTLKRLKQNGLKGDELRAAIAGTFHKKG